MTDGYQLPPKPLTPDEVAKRWGCSSNHVRKLINEGKLPAFRIGAKLARVRPQDVEAYEAKASAQAQSRGPSIEETRDTTDQLRKIMRSKRVMASLQRNRKNDQSS